LFSDRFGWEIPTSNSMADRHRVDLLAIIR